MINQAFKSAAKDAQIGFDFLKSGVDPKFKAAVKAKIQRLPQLHPDIKIRINWRKKMGFIVTYQDKEIWSPSLTVGNLYLEQIASIEKITGQSSGVTSTFDDEIEVDKENLENFINASLGYLQNSNNTALIALFAGCIEVSLYVYYLVTDIWLEIPFNLRFLNEKAQAIANV